MPVAYTVREVDGTPRTAAVDRYNPSELFADVGEDNASGFTRRQLATVLPKPKGQEDWYFLPGPSGRLWAGRCRRNQGRAT